MSKILLACLAWLAAFLVSPGAHAQQAAFPSQNLRMIIAQTAGGPTDVLSRLIAQKLSDSLGKAAVAENRPGASGNLGTDIVAKARPDGHTMMINVPSVLAINEMLYKQVPFDAARDLEGVARIVTSQFVLVAHPSFQPNTIQELVAFARAKPAGSISFASSGIGSPQHLGGELLATKSGIKLNHVPYKGAVPALNDLLGGQVPLAIVGLPAALPHVRAGKLKAIAVFGSERAPTASEVPTFVESGYPDIVMELVYVLFTTRGTPAPTVARLNQELATILKMPDVREKLAAMGFTLSSPGNPAELDAYLRSEQLKWQPIVRASGATAE